MSALPRWTCCHRAFSVAVTGSVPGEYGGGAGDVYGGGSVTEYGGGASTPLSDEDVTGVVPVPPVVSGCEGPSVRPVPPPVRDGPSEPPVPEEATSPPETVGGLSRNPSSMLRSSALPFLAPSVSVASTWLLMPAPTKVDQLVDQSPSNAPLTRISASASPEPAARKSAVPLMP
ncbi:hypothetical protein GCM10010469_06370 [Streptomyces labedae]|uniref:Secreted protein n=1 Tax=Streptomyces labedae TaxID=285569 RepID=A0ABP6QSY7_9ACTN